MFDERKRQRANFDPADELVHEDRDIGDSFIDLVAAGEFQF